VRIVKTIKLVGQYDVVAHLLVGGAPLHHIDNLAWASLIEAAALGDGVTPLQHATSRNYS
jgi:hypothetical protein